MNPDTTLIGIDMGGTKVNVGLVKNNEIIDQRYRLIPQNTSHPDTLISIIIDLINQLIASEKIVGIGIGVPSIVDRENGIVYEVQNIPSWKKVNLGEIISNEFDVPVYLDNDANCFTLGEFYFGNGQNVQNMVGVTLGTGLGAGIINRGKLLADAHGGSGEFGMIPYLNGILEDYCSGKYFRTFYNVKGEDLHNSALKGDSKAIKIFNEYGKHLAQAIKIIMYTIDPELIVLGGSITKSKAFFDLAMREALNDFGFKRILDDINIVYTKTLNISILGAAALYFDRQNSK